LQQASNASHDIARQMEDVPQLLAGERFAN
jgi:hypothetical protein